MSHWQFSEPDGQLVITTPHTPRPWINYLTNGRYFALISQTGGGFSFLLDPSHHVLTRREQNMLLDDRPGRFVFVQDAEDGSCWNIGGHPCPTPLEQFSCRHGFGSTRIQSRCKGIVGQIEFFVPTDVDAEVWHIRLENSGQQPRRLRVVAYQEWVLGNSLVDPIARRFDCFFKHAVAGRGVVIARKLVWGLRGSRANRPWPFEVFCASTLPPAAVWLDKAEFIGPYRDLSRPQAMDEPGRMPACGEQVWGVDLIGAPQWHVELPAGQSADWYLTTGIASAGEGQQQAAALVDPQRLEQLADAARRHWSERLGRLSLRTPSAALDQLHGRWTPYQVIIKSYLSSAPSYYHASDGSPGLRDALQDAFGLCLLEPQRAREMILRLARFQLADGSASHRAPRVPLPPERSEKSDLPLWFSLPTLQYVRETGDTSIIDEQVPYADGPAASLLEHIRVGLERSLRDTGRRGLPLIHYGDWNDALDGLGGEGRGESVFLGQFLAFSLASAAELARLVGQHELADRWQQQRRRLCQIINEQCWDEDRYVRAFHDDGTVIGCRSNREGRLYLNPQVWAVLADIAPPERQRICMNTVWNELDTPDGIRCLAPPYSNYDPHVGLISCFPPGVKENGAIFSHAMAFCLVAELMLRRADRAWSIFEKANPILRARARPQYAMEPNVYCQFVAGPETNLAGQGFHHWLTGTCSWMQYAVVNWLLGARAELEGLRIDPCIPPDWRGFELVRPFRGSTVHIAVENPAGCSGGIRQLTVDGAPLAGSLIPPPTSAHVHVRAVMG